jgi:uncharacterized protein (TIGR01777 family)
MTGKNILITGGSGAIARQLSRLLLEEGYTVSQLSRKPGNNPQINTYLWDLDSGEIDERCLDGIDTIIHLAGENIAGKPWSKRRKKQLIESRTKSIGLIYALMQRRPHTVQKVISASAVGYYSNRGDELVKETSVPGNDFLAQCCMAWETKVDEGKALNLEVIKFRTGVVLDVHSGALNQLAKPVKNHVGIILGNGKQWVSWIHIGDVLRMYLFALQNTQLSGVYNMVAPHPVTHQTLIKTIARHLNKRIWLPQAPAFGLKIILGEMSKIILDSTRVSADKIMQAGFQFKYPTIEAAISDLYDQQTKN